ncbi:MAG: hypothetical protein NTX56_11975 [Proteobacteria bacterium]|nr:hypothetical protein [Pseudomonadota bacterium]
MKKVIAGVLAIVLAGCSGLNVQWAATATYNTPASTQTTMNPGATNETVSGPPK